MKKKLLRRNAHCYSAVEDDCSDDEPIAALEITFYLKKHELSIALDVFP